MVRGTVDLTEEDRSALVAPAFECHQRAEHCGAGSPDRYTQYRGEQRLFRILCANYLPDSANTRILKRGQFGLGPISRSRF